MFLSLGRISGIIVAAGSGSSVDFLTGDLGFKLPNLHKKVFGSSMVSHNSKIILCGGIGNEKRCLIFDHGTWKEHSTLDMDRALHSAVATQVATFIFGGTDSRTTYGYLPIDSTEWLMGKTELPGGFSEGCAITVKSGQEIWLIGGFRTEKRILGFDVESHTFQVLPFQLNVGRIGHRCAFIPYTNKIMITGGCSDGYLGSTEVLDIKGENVTMASPMNIKRAGHGMGVFTINGKDRLVVFGGFDGISLLDSVELINTLTGKWEFSFFKLSEPKSHFSFLTVKLGDILPNLQ